MMMSFNPAFGIQFGEAEQIIIYVVQMRRVSIPRSGFSSVKHLNRWRVEMWPQVSIPRSGFSSVKPPLSRLSA